MHDVGRRRHRGRARAARQESGSPRGHAARRQHAWVGSAPAAAASRRRRSRPRRARRSAGSRPRAEPRGPRARSPRWSDSATASAPPPRSAVEIWRILTAAPSPRAVAPTRRTRPWRAARLSSSSLRPARERPARRARREPPRPCRAAPRPRRPARPAAASPPTAPRPTTTSRSISSRETPSRAATAASRRSTPSSGSGYPARAALPRRGAHTERPERLPLELRDRELAGMEAVADHAAPTSAATPWRSSKRSQRS